MDKIIAKFTSMIKSWSISFQYLNNLVFLYDFTDARSFEDDKTFLLVTETLDLSRTDLSMIVP